MKKLSGLLVCLFFFCGFIFGPSKKDEEYNCEYACSYQVNKRPLISVKCSLSSEEIKEDCLAVCERHMYLFKTAFSVTYGYDVSNEHLTDMFDDYYDMNTLCPFYKRKN